ncbi:unnamed protein product [Dimorphilus gyrociliatus]|uniref:Apple domain-containing protein n=1 Tax=Dimorphilus gyrociliatus TaxID=2664684 RepID=A0A7I8VGQ8_9ANNE|nr:unnamed protein product [Dimorphilus gyrociliatus]
MYWNIFLISYSILFNFRVQSVIPSVKFKCGGSSIDETLCIAYGCMWNSGICSYSKNFIRGFNTMNGKETSNNVILNTFSSSTAIKCAKECLKIPACASFSYVVDDLFCTIKSQVVTTTVVESKSEMQYNRKAHPELTCFQAHCYDEPGVKRLLTYRSDPLTSCLANCKATSSCTHITLSHEKDNYSCFLGKKLCNVFSDKFRSKPYQTTCLIGPIFHNSLNQKSQRLTNLTDNLADTCVKVTAENEFYLRIPWPSLGKPTTEFEIRIRGLDMSKCFHFSEQSPLTGLTTFIPLDDQTDAIFSGQFRGCKLKTEYSGTDCTYTCTCGFNYCQAVYIKAFAEIGKEMSICSYEIDQP